MKKFIVQIVIFSTIILLSFYGVLMLFDGYTDPYYVRFTTPKQNSLILGSSRSAHGIRPKVLNENIEGCNIFNYSFTVFDSPYGPHYYNSIRHKLDTSKNVSGTFIISVDPWVLSSVDDEKPNDTTLFRENNKCVALVENVSQKPNIDYITKCYDKSYYSLFVSKVKKGIFFLHDDGWLEGNIPIDTVLFNSKRKDLTPYKNPKTDRNYAFSSKRFEYLKKTIELLAVNNNQVYLLRMPIHDKMLKVENEFMPDFNDKMNALSSTYKIPYLNMMSTNKELLFIDRHHMHKSSSKKFTLLLSEAINTCNKK